MGTTGSRKCYNGPYSLRTSYVGFRVTTASAGKIGRGRKVRPVIRVKFYGRLKARYGIRLTKVEGTTLEEIIDAIVERHPEVRREDLRNATVIVNRKEGTGKDNGGHSFSAGDELVFISPVGGG